MPLDNKLMGLPCQTPETRGIGLQARALLFSEIPNLDSLSQFKRQHPKRIALRGNARQVPKWGVALLALLFAIFVCPDLALAQESGEAEAAPQGGGFFQILFAGGIIGILIILLLVSLSLTAGYLVLDHVFNLRRKDILPDGLSEQVRSCLQAGRVEEAEKLCQGQPSFLSFVLLHGIAELEFGWSAVEKAMEDAIAEQAARLFRKIEYLSVIGNIAPMVGLLGTVVGMVLAFKEVANSGGAAGAGALAEGIYQALVTTVGGLIVAIPALGAFAIFRNRIDQLVAEAAYSAQHVFGPLRKKAKARPAK